jgi:hypothetical protein
MAYLKDFDLVKVTQIKAGMPKNRFWAQTICAGLLGAVLFGGSERISVTSAPYNIDHALGIGYGRMASYVVYTSAIKSIPIDDRSNTQNASESDQKNQQVFPVSAVPY